MSDQSAVIDEYMRLAGLVQEARVEFAKLWQFNRPKATSDMMATQMTIEQTGDRLGYLEAALRAQEALMCSK